jgi:hypothetical protein
MLPEDSLETALPTIRSLSDSRIQHFYDPKQVSGKEIALSVGWAGHTAWDIYLYYPPIVKWTESPPKPASWMHQVSDEWARNEHYHTGDSLKHKLDVSLKTLLEE